MGGRTVPAVGRSDLRHVLCVGPDSLTDCERDATLTFKLDGQQAAETAVNGVGGGDSFDLSLR